MMQVVAIPTQRPTINQTTRVLIELNILISVIRCSNQLFLLFKTGIILLKYKYIFTQINESRLKVPL